MAERNMKLSGTYDSIEAYAILEEIRSIRQATETALQEAKEALAVATTLKNTSQAAVESVAANTQLTLDAKEEAQAAANRAAVSEKNSKASEDATLKYKNDANDYSNSAKISAENSLNYAQQAEAIAKPDGLLYYDKEGYSNILEVTP